MDANETKLILKQEVYQIIGAALEVSNQLGCGFLEAVYQEALGLELSDRQIPHVQQPRLQITYKNTVLNTTYMADFLCFDKIIIEIKAIKKISTIEEAQIFNYLRASGHPVGLLVNFGAPKLEWKRFVKTSQIGVYMRSLTKFSGVEAPSGSVSEEGNRE